MKTNNTYRNLKVNTRSFYFGITNSITLAGMLPVGKNIKQIRLARGLSQVQLAEICGWEDGQARISHYETSKRIPNANDLICLANALDCSVGEMFGEKEYPERDPDKLNPGAVQLAYKLSQLSPARQKLVLQIVLELLQNNQQEVSTASAALSAL